MARTEIPIVVIDPATGNAVTSANVTVVNRATSANATIYAGETGATTVANPRVTDSNGRLTGWVERGGYRLDITGSGLTAYSKNWDSAPAADASVDNPWLSQAAAWTTYTPTLTAATTNPTLGAGAYATGRYTQVGRLVIGKCKIQFGTGYNAGSGAYWVSLPVTARAVIAGEAGTAGYGFLFNGNTNAYVPIQALQLTTTTVGLYYGATYNGAATIATHAVPWAWISNCSVEFQFQYEAAA